MQENTSVADNFFNVSVGSFEGPIDLLLHLVKKNELEITRLSLATVCEQYLSCLTEMRVSLDLEMAGDYLVIAATLLSIKSSILLNKPVEFIEDSEGNLVDPHEELLRRLKEAQVYKDSAVELGSYEYLHIDVFPPKATLREVRSMDMGLQSHEAYLLSKAFWKMLKQLNDQKVYEVILESVSILERMNSVMDRLNLNGGQLSFMQLAKDLKSKGQLIGTFLALLELCKRQAISVMQSQDSEEIYVALAGVGIADLQPSEFDQEAESKKAV